MSTRRDYMIQGFLQTALTLFTFSVLQCIVPVAHAEDDTSESLKAYAGATTAIDASYYGEDLFSYRNAEELQRLKQSPLTRVALRSAFESVLRSAEPDSSEPVDGEVVQRFFGFLEGRLFVAVPHWWEAALRDGHTIGTDKRRYFIPGGLPEMETRFHEQLNGWWVSAPVEAHVDHEDVVLSLRGSTLRVPQADLEQDMFKGIRVHGLEVVAQDTSWVIAAMTERGYPFRILVVNREDGRLRWKNLVWAAGPILSYEGRGVLPQFVEVRVHDERVVVWGAAFDAAFCEEFDLNTGEAVARFSTSY